METRPLQLSSRRPASGFASYPSTRRRSKPECCGRTVPNTAPGGRRTRQLEVPHPPGLGAERRAMPSAVGFSQEKVFEHELGFAGRKRSSARCTPYPRIDAAQQSLNSNHLIERPAMRADEIDLCGLDQRVFGCRNGHWTAAMTLT
jgi:hypothetical protein